MVTANGRAFVKADGNNYITLRDQATGALGGKARANLYGESFASARGQAALALFGSSRGRIHGSEAKAHAYDNTHVESVNGAVATLYHSATGSVESGGVVFSWPEYCRIQRKSVATSINPCSVEGIAEEIVNATREAAQWVLARCQGLFHDLQSRLNN
jgi:hypothetical protein